MRNMGLLKSKKATFNVLLALIVTLFVGLLILIIGYQMHQNSKDVDDDEKCRLSIFANHQIGRARQESKGMLDFPVAFDCPRKFVKIEMEDVEKYRRIDDDLIKTVVAEEIKSCWAKTGAGKLDPFKASTTVDESFCMVCSDIIFAPDVLEQAGEEGYTFKGFQYWMATHKLPGIKTTLYEYLTGKRPDTETLRQLMETQNDDRYTININEKYVVVWRVQKYEPGWWERVSGAIAGALTMVVGVILLPVGGVGVGVIAAGAGAIVGYTAVSSGQGNTGFQAGVFLAPEERLSSMMISPEELMRRVRASVSDRGIGGSGIGGTALPKNSELYFCTIMIN